MFASDPQCLTVALLRFQIVLSVLVMKRRKTVQDVGSSKDADSSTATTASAGNGESKGEQKHKGKSKRKPRTAQTAAEMEVDAKTTLDSQPENEDHHRPHPVCTFCNVFAVRSLFFRPFRASFVVVC